MLYDPYALDSLVYTEMVSLTLAAGAESTVAFPDHNVGMDEGDWMVKCSTFYVSDTFPDNDVRMGNFTVTSVPPWPSGWHEVASMPIGPSGKAVKRGAWNSFNPLDRKFYITKGYKTTDFYKYDPVNDLWDTLTGMPYTTHPMWGRKVPRKGSKGAMDRTGTTGDPWIYVTQGNNSLGFWRYSTETDSWEILPDVPLGTNRKKVKGGTDMEVVPVPDPQDSIVAYLYLMKGYRDEFYRAAIWKLDHGTDQPVFGVGGWEPMPPVGETGNDASLLTRNKVDKGSWLEWDGDAYLYAHTAKYHDFIRYPLNDSGTGYWEAPPGGGRAAGMPFIGWNGRRKKSKDGGSAAYYDNAFYALKGGNTQQWWKYDIPETTWTELDTMPKYGSAGRK
jgi:hypothetical protein